MDEAAIDEALGQESRGGGRPRGGKGERPGAASRREGGGREGGGGRGMDDAGDAGIYGIV